MIPPTDFGTEPLPVVPESRMVSNSYLIIQLLQAFEWFDESLQLSLRELGWPAVTRPESMVLMHITIDIVQPAAIARSLRLTRQAVHSTISGLVNRGICELAPDPDDKRVKIVQLTEMGAAMRRDAQKIVNELTGVLRDRVGAEQVNVLIATLDGNWGEPLVARVEGGPDAFFREKLRVMASRGRRAQRTTS